MSIQLFEFNENILDKPAICYQDKVINYAQLLEKGDAISHLIGALSIEGRIGICIGNEPLFISSLLGIHNIEGSVVLLNSQSKFSELNQQITKLNLKYLFITDTTSTLFEQVSSAAELIYQLQDNDFGNLQVWKLNEVTTSTTLSLVSNKPSDKEFIVTFTSGVSGASRVVSRSYKNLQKELDCLLDAFEYTDNDKIICPVPVFHSYGLVNGVFAALRANACLYLIPQFTPDQALRLIETSKATVFIGVPLMYSLLNQSLDEKEPDVSSLRICLSAGAKLDIAIAKVFKERFGIPINQLYGSTETGAVAANLFKDGFSDPQSVGQVFKETKIVPVNSEGVELSAGQEGRLKIKSEAITKGYLNEVTLNKQVFKDNWYFPGDIGKFDKAGNLYITGRNSSFINVAGKKVDPFEIEQVLLLINGVQECVVLGVPHAEVEELIVAGIVLSQPISESSIIKFCSERLTNYKIPNKIQFLKTLPRNAVGKILKNQLKEQFIVQYTAQLNQLHSNESVNIENTAEQISVLKDKASNLPISEDAPQYDKKQTTTFEESNRLKNIASANNTELRVAAIKLMSFFLRNSLYEEDVIETDTTFIEMGIDSILMTKLAIELGGFYGIDLSPSVFYNYPTFEKSAAFLVKNYSVELSNKHGTKLSVDQKDSTLAPPVFSAAASKQHQKAILFNHNAPPIVFFFPAFFGLAMGYQKLAAICTQTRFYCFDFLEAENRMDIYYQQIKRQQPTGPYVLFGYSAGGNLAFEAARYMENKGDIVSDIIFADSYIEPSMKPFDFEEFMDKSRKIHYLPEQIEYLVENKSAYEKTKKRTTAFHHFLSHLKMKPIIQANIHNLLAVDDGTRESVSFNWVPYTRGEYKTYVAEGFHADLLIPPYLSVTAAILSDILEQIDSHSRLCV